MRNDTQIAGLGIPFFILIFLVVLAGTWRTGVLNIVFTRHSQTSHAEAVSEIDNCFNGGGTLSATFKMANGRYSQYCSDGGKNNFWRIFECSGAEREVVTQFKQEVRQLLKYIRNHGMVEGVIPCS
jgi:hypothetical protein